MNIYIGVHVPCNLINGYMYTHSYAVLIHLTWLLSFGKYRAVPGKHGNSNPPLPRAHSATQTYTCTVIGDVNYRPYTFVIVPFNGSNLEQSQCRLQHEHSSLQSVFQHILFRCQTVLHVPRNELLYHQRFQWHMMQHHNKHCNLFEFMTKHHQEIFVFLFRKMFEHHKEFQVSKEYPKANYSLYPNKYAWVWDISVDNIKKYGCIKH